LATLFTFSWKKQLKDFEGDLCVIFITSLQKPLFSHFSRFQTFNS